MLVVVSDVVLNGDNPSLYVACQDHPEISSRMILARQKSVKHKRRGPLSRLVSNFAIAAGLR
jgi:hypothetical protein